ncbi:cytidylyltransferase domain-containing protein [Pelosinus sp. sgz500959]|uniref:cytidylyltransferase domain-containing protein n=1 Tax=Pelosinus sp. sgz500959 TaxID=3242472 RepID=UPI0036700170
MKTVIIVQARMTSTRLPAKVLMPILGKPLLTYQIERMKRIKLADEIVIATTTNDDDQTIVDLCEKLSISYFRGSELNVLERYYEAAKKYNADHVVRLTSDCPLIDPAVVDKVIAFYKENKSDYDYVSNTLKRTYPRGLDTEVFSFQILHQAYQEAIEMSDKEHVTPFIYGHPDRYRLANVFHTENLSTHRWTVDTVEDFQLIHRMIEQLYPIKQNFTLQDCIELLDQYPAWKNINSHIEQKKM